MPKTLLAPIRRGRVVLLWLARGWAEGTLGTGVRAETAACGRGGGAAEQRPAFLRCEWDSGSHRRPLRVTRPISLSLGRITCHLRDAQRTDFLPDETKPPLAPGRAEPSSPHVPPVLGYVGGSVGFHASVYAPRTRVAMNLDISSLKSQGYQCPRECLSLTRDEGGPAPRLLGTPNCSRCNEITSGAPGGVVKTALRLSNGGACFFQGVS